MFVSPLLLLYTFYNFICNYFILHLLFVNGIADQTVRTVRNAPQRAWPLFEWGQHHQRPWLTDLMSKRPGTFLNELAISWMQYTWRQLSDSNIGALPRNCVFQKKAIEYDNITAITLTSTTSRWQTLYSNGIIHGHWVRALHNLYVLVSITGRTYSRRSMCGLLSSEVWGQKSQITFFILYAIYVSFFFFFVSQTQYLLL